MKVFGKTGLVSMLVFLLAGTTFLSLSDAEQQKRPEKEIRQSVKSDKTLREAYKDYFPIGTAIYSGYLKHDHRDSFVAQQYSSVTPEDQMKPFIIQPEEGVFNFKPADELVDFALKNEMKVRGHCLIWFHRMPKWFYRDGNKIASKDLVLRRMKAHITAVMQRYKGKIYCYDVVNEAVTWRKNQFFKTEDTLYTILGEEYISKAFQFAREADPSARLFYNEIWFGRKEKRDALFEWIKKLKNQGVPIDGIGMQCHLTIKGTEEEFFRETIDMYHSIGLEFQVTELDISIYKSPNPHDVIRESEEYSAEIQEKQTEFYEMIFRVCRENKGKVTGITLWAPSDGNNFLTQYLKKDNYPYLFDRQLKPKKAFYKVTEFR